MKLKLGFSTCPNDTFIFDAMVHNRIDTEGLEFDIIMADVEELNKMSFEQELDITKISYHAYAYIADKYKILNAGSALGNNNGPLLISKKKIYPDEVPFLKIAIPGKYTTANLLLNYAYSTLKETKEYLFSDIEDAVLYGEVDAGLIIHESRFTYQKKGMQKILDIGEFWEQKTKLPVPLGGIIVNRQIDVDTQLKIDRVLRRSVEFAFQNPRESINFIRQYAQELDDEVMQKHIDLYVNNFTVDLGEQGKNAIKFLLKVAVDKKFVSYLPSDIFVEK